jgi:hypothetical protein
MSDRLPPKDPNLWYIYVLVDPITDEIGYVGYTINPFARMREHMRLDSNNKRKNTWLSSVWRWHGVPEMVIIESGSGPGWKDREMFYIAKYRAEGYDLTNITAGGQGGAGKTLSPEHRAQISARAKSPEAQAHRLRLAESRRGTQVSDETRQKVSEGVRKRLPELKQKWSEKRRGRLKSEEHKRKIGLAHKGKLVSSETRAKMSARAKDRTPEHNEKIRQKLLAYNANKRNTRTNEDNARTEAS